MLKCVKVIKSRFHHFNATLVSDIAIFVLKRDVKLQLTNFNATQFCCELQFRSQQHALDTTLLAL